MSTFYCHEPLPNRNSTRLLRVHGNPFSTSEITCDIICVDLQDPPPFEAISYTWQGQPTDQRVYVGASLLEVTVNCHEALRHFRPIQARASRLLWIDIVCIDQSKHSLREKGHQISLMGQIFASAQCVLVWLEPYPVSQDLRASHVRAFMWLSELAATSAIAVPSHRKTKLCQLLEVACPEDLTEFSRSIPWWKRLWTLQEVALSKNATLVYGSFEILLWQLMAGRQAVEDILAEGRGPRHIIGARLHDMFAVHHKTIGREPLVSTMEQMRYSKTTEPHDNVFAIFGILRARGLTLPTPDYSRPVADIYREAAVALIELEGYDELIHQIGLPKNIPDLPSWVPDWSHDKHPRRCNYILRRHKGASLSSKLEFRFGGQKRHLILRGMIVDTIVDRAESSFIHGHGDLGPTTGEFGLNEVTAHEFIDMYGKSAQEDFNVCAAAWNLRCLQSFIRFAGFHEDDRSVDKKKFRTLHCMTWHLDDLEDDFSAVNRLCALVNPEQQLATAHPHSSVNESPLVRSTSLRSDLNPLQMIRQDAQLDKHFTAFSQDLIYQTMFRTSCGHIGIAPYSVRAGDQVALLGGVNCPVVIRPHVRAFGIISLAYIHDYMDGQQWPETQDALQDLRFV